MERAAEWIFNHPEESTAMELDVGAGTQDASSAEASLPDGSGSKSLILFWFSRIFGSQLFRSDSSMLLVKVDVHNPVTY